MLLRDLLLWLSTVVLLFHWCHALPDGSACTNDADCDSNKCKTTCCAAGMVPQCDTCDASGDCIACQSGYYVTGGSCQQKLLSGVACSADGECADGNCKGECCKASVDAACNICDGPGDCIDCPPTHYISGGSCSLKETTGVVCNNDTSCSTGVCRSQCCKATVDVECTNCDNAGDCTACDSNHFVVNGNCIPKLLAGSSCSADADCADGKCASSCCNTAVGGAACTACDGSGKCTACQAGYYVNAGSCQLQQSDGHTCNLDTDCTSGTCSASRCCKTSAVTGCTACDHNGDCTSCLSGYTLGGTSCAADVTGGSTCSVNGDCGSGLCLSTKCCTSGISPTACTACDGSGKCSTCAATHFLRNGNCIAKTAVGAACSASTECLSSVCGAGTCCKATVSASCTECDASGDCVACAATHYVDTGSCTLKKADGSACSAGECSSISCKTTCCVAAMSSSCTTCDVSGLCTGCAATHYLNGGLCSLKLGDGMYCTADDMCTNGKCAANGCCKAGVSASCTACSSWGDCIATSAPTPAPPTPTPAPTTPTPAPTVATPSPTTIPATPVPTAATPVPTTATPSPTTVVPTTAAATSLSTSSDLSTTTPSPTTGVATPATTATLGPTTVAALTTASSAPSVATTDASTSAPIATPAPTAGSAPEPEGPPQFRLDSCTTLSVVYESEPFTMAFAGQALDASDEVAIVPAATACTDPSARFVPVSEANNNGTATSLSYTIAESNRSFALCYRSTSSNSTTTRCQNTVQASGEAPWVSPVARAAVAAAVMESSGVSVSETNEKQCNSLSPAAAVLLHPVAGEATFGSFGRPYGTNEQCLLVIEPQPQTTQPASFMQLTLNREFASSDVAVRVFVVQNASTGSETLPPSEASSFASCPATMAGFTLVHAGGSETNSIAQLLLPRTRIVIALCTSDAPAGGKRVSVSYQTQDTRCPNDCRDSTGVSRGTCDASGTCVCNPNWEGSSCNRFTGCERDEASPTLTGSGTGRIEHASQSAPLAVCGYRVLPDSSRHNRRGPLGLGFRINTAALSSANCSENFIRFVGAAGSSAPGIELKRICQADLAALLQFGPSLPWLARTSDGTPFVGSIYVEVAGGPQDTVDIAFASVAASCPGTTDGSGFVVPGQECGGRGTCVAIDYDASPSLLESNSKCVCSHPFAASTIGELCDTCAFGLDPSTFPRCNPPPVCTNNCSSSGSCTSDGCVCNTDRFGPGCAYSVVDVQLQSRLIVRSPLDRGYGGNAIVAGSIDRQRMTCNLPGKQCAAAIRSRGQLYGGLLDPELQTSSSRRQGSTAPTPAINVDRGVSLNALSVPGSAGDFLINDKIRGTKTDFSGEFTFTAWVRLTTASTGFLLVKADNARTPEGVFPAVDAALLEVRDRHNRPRVLDQDSLLVYAAIFANGPQRQIDVMFSRRTGDGDVEVVVRHFRLDGDDHGLFDGSWRMLSVSFDEDTMRGRVFVDGETDPISPGYMQCFPFFPGEVNAVATSANSSRFAPQIASSDTDGVLLFGYGLKGDLDEVRLYEGVVSQATIVDIGGEDLLGALREDRGALLAMACIGGLVCALATTIRLRTMIASDDASTEPSVSDGEPSPATEAEEWLALHTAAAPASSPDDTEARSVECLRQAMQLTQKNEDAPSRYDLPSELDGDQHLADTEENAFALSGCDILVSSVDFDEEETDAVATERSAADSSMRNNSILLRHESVRSNDGLRRRSTESSGASYCSPLHSRAMSINKIAFTHERPVWNDPMTWAVFVDPTLAAESMSHAHLTSWIQKQLESCGVADCTSEQQERIAAASQAFIKVHHGTAGGAALSLTSPAIIEMRNAMIDVVGEKDTEDDSRPTAAVRHRRLVHLLAAILSIREATLKRIAPSQHPIIGSAIALFALPVSPRAAETEGPKRSFFSELRANIAANVQDFSQRAGLLRDFWQVLALLIGAMAFPSSTSSSYGAFASAVSLTFDSQLGLHFAVPFYLCCAISMIAFIGLVFVFASVSSSGQDSGVGQQIDDQLERQIDRVAKGKTPSESRSAKERLAQLILLTLTTLYLPTTRIVLLGVFCHEDVLCLYDCYVDPEHKLIVAVGIVVGLCVTVISPILFFIAALRKQREVGDCFGSPSGADADALWEQFLVVDTSPFSSLYGPYRRRWGQAASVMLLVKAGYVVITLSTAADTTAQIVSATLVLSAMTFASAVVVPYRYRMCNFLLLGLQAALLLVLSLHVAHRLSPDTLAIPIGMVQIVVLTIVLALHFPALFFSIGRRSE